MHEYFSNLMRDPLKAMKRPDGYYPYKALPLMNQYNAQDVVCGEHNPSDSMVNLGYTDRMMTWDREGTRQIIKKHTGRGALGLGRWVNTHSVEIVTALIQDLNNLHGNGKRVVGWRVIRYTDVSNGYATFAINITTKEND